MKTSLKADAAGGGQQLHHVVGKKPVLRAVSFIAHDDDVVIRRDGVGVVIVEFLNQREDIAGIALQHLNEPRTAGRDKRAGFHAVKTSAALESSANLLVQLVPVGQHNDRRTARKLAADFLRQKHHGVAFAAALRVPEYA